MHTKPPISAGARRRVVRRFVPALALLPLTAAFSQTIPNPSFEADTGVFTVSPGYVAGNVPITGWNGSDAARYGINPSAGSPFANNGTIPDGAQVAFIQSAGGPTTLSTVISDLTAGQKYQLWFRANARGSQQPVLSVAVDGLTLLTGVIDSVGGTAPYRYVAVEFTANDTVAALDLSNNTAVDTTVVVDDFRIKPATSAWTYASWSDDASSGVDPSAKYTHAYNFGSTASPAIQGVRFTGVGGTNPAVAGKFATTNLTGVFANDADNFIADAGSSLLGRDFVYNGFPTTLTLQGLTPGQEYLCTIYSTGWEAPGARIATFRSGTDMLSIDQNAFAKDNGITFTCRYTAQPDGTAVIATDPIQAASIHWYGFSNRAVAIPTTPGVTSDPVGGTVAIGEVFELSAAISGERPMDFQWQKNGVDIPGETDPTLSLTIASAADAAFYRLKGTNVHGTATTNAVFVEVRESVPLFNTGVDATGLPLATGEVDPHWQIVVNPDNPGIPDAFVQDAGLFPIVAGPWIPNTGASAWIGPRTETSAAAGPLDQNYVYQTTFDLTSASADFVLSGGVAVDNVLMSVAVNDVPVTGLPLSQGFNALTAFSFRGLDLPEGTLLPGVNTLSLAVQNQGAGYTGLHVQNLRLLAVPAGVKPIIVTQPQTQTIVSGTTATLTASAYGSATITWQWTKNGNPLPGQTTPVLQILDFGPFDNGTYRAVATNGSGFAESDPAELTASNVPASVVTSPQAPAYVASGEDVTLTVAVSGSEPFTYVWMFEGNDIPNNNAPTLTLTGVDAADSGKYSVRVTNAFGTDTSAETTLTVYQAVPGLFDTGVDDTGVPLADGSSDLHYTIILYANEVSLVPATVHSSTVFPIVAGPWVANSASSKWVAPALETNNPLAAGGSYKYRATFDLTGFDPATVAIVGKWATDNDGTDILVNTNPTGLVNTTQFGSFTTFVITPQMGNFVEGLNSIDFVVNNAAAGPTALRVEGLRGYGFPAVAVNVPVVSITLNGSGQPTLTFTGEPGATYNVERSITLLENDWSPLGTATNDNGAVSFTDPNPPVGTAYYRVILP